MQMVLMNSQGLRLLLYASTPPPLLHHWVYCKAVMRSRNAAASIPG